MIQLLLGGITLLTAACVVLFLVIKAQVKRADKARAEAQTLHKAFWETKQKGDRLQQANKKQAETEVRANEERKELSSTADADLVHRANQLFGVQNH